MLKKHIIFSENVDPEQPTSRHILEKEDILWMYGKKSA
jgi:hypothetical protein